MLLRKILMLGKRKILVSVEILKVFEFVQKVPHEVSLLEGSNTQKQYPIKPLMVSYGIKKSLNFGFS